MRPKFFEVADPRIGGILAAELDENPQLATLCAASFANFAGGVTAFGFA